MWFVRGIAWAVVGALPGLALYLVADFLIVGEWQLTIGAPGLVLLIAGAVIGFGLGVFDFGRPRRRC